MNKKIFTLVILLSVLPGSIQAKEMSLMDQVVEARAELQQVQALNTELIAKLAEKEREVAELKERARELDEEIAALKEEYGMEEDA